MDEVMEAHNESLFVVIIAANHSIKAGLACLGGATKTQLAQLPITKLPIFAHLGKYVNVKPI